MNIFEERESNVRSYCRSFPDTFVRTKGAIMTTESGREFIDFFAGAGALNYGHNNDFIKERLIAYLEQDGPAHGLDMYTGAKREFLETFTATILEPKGLDYRVQFTGPTGTNAVEAALKLARKVKKRTGVFSFMGAFHGMSLGSLSITSNKQKRAGAGLPLNDVTFMPFPHGFYESFDTLGYLEAVLTDNHSGIEKPAAIIMETVQAEGGVVVAPVEWLQGLREICTRHDILLICDEIQVGCGRTGPFFSFERAGIEPDIVVLSKSISGYGLPMALVLMKPELDIWAPGEHNGTFRGNQMAFIGATAALEYREQFNMEEDVARKELFVKNFLEQEVLPLHDSLEIRGLGLIWGIDFSKLDQENICDLIQTQCYENGLIIETAGRTDRVLKIMPPLTIEMEQLEKGCATILEAIRSQLKVPVTY